MGIVGVGAIGSSIGMAYRAAGNPVFGLDPSSKHLDLALGRRAISRACETVQDLAGCRTVFVATPPGAVVGAVREALQASGGTVLDVASVKVPVMQAVDHPRFVASHPMRGTHLSGPQGASIRLFHGATWALCPGRATSPSALDDAFEAVTALGAEPLVIDACTHDEVVAATSHLPHIAASALVNVVGATNPALAGRLIGGGFLDTTCIARANPQMWADIVLANSEEVTRTVDELVGQLHELSEAVAAGDRAAVQAFFRGSANLLTQLAGPDRLEWPAEAGSADRAAGMAAPRRPWTQLKGAH